MVKILAQAGISLADTYDIEGSIVGVERLEPGEVQVVHEMGAVIASERMIGNILRVTTGDLLQSISWNLLIPSLPDTALRTLGVSVVAITGSRVDNCQVSIRDDTLITAGVEIPIFAWAATPDDEVPFRWVNNGAGVAEARLLRQFSPVPGVPSMGFGTDQRESTPAIVFRGATTAFGAGNVEIVAQIYASWIGSAGRSSFGVPIPSW